MARLHLQLAAAVAVTATFWLGTTMPAKAVEPRELRTVWIPREDSVAEQAAAKLLQEGFQALYGFRPAVVAGPPSEGTAGVVVGRQLALASGQVTEAELAEVKFDGYIIKAQGNRIMMAGYDRVGTRYAPAALLHRLGMRWVPWAGSISNAVEAVAKDPPSRIGPFLESCRPFYEYRDLMSQVRPDLFRTMYRDYRLNDPSKAANPDLFANPAATRPADYTRYPIDRRQEWTGWCHTAPYLVPRDLYYAEHPEYFAMYDGKRIAPTGYAGMAICESNLEGLKIATARAMELIELQKDRRFFSISQADARLCACPDCLKADPLPDYATDRLIGWVNALARPARARYPDKSLTTLAYMETVKPPVKTRPEANVSVMYCPWLWNSRGSSHKSFEGPVNLTAMREFAGWVLWCPGQVAVYDYAYGDAVDGSAERIKLYARFGVRQAYFNGAKHDRLLWLGSQLLWDPFQDIEPLNEEFVRLYYGPAAGPMGRLLAMEQDAIRRFVVHRKAAFEPQRHDEAPWWNDFCRATRALVAAAEDASASTDEATRIRILAGCCVAVQKVLTLTHPARGGLGLRATVAVYQQDLAHARRLAQAVLATCGRNTHRYLLRRYQEDLAGPLEAMGDGATGASIGDELRRIDVRFDGADEAGKWLADATRAELIAPIRAAPIIGAAGAAVQGVSLDAPLSRLPVVPRGNITIHAGRFYCERVLDRPLEADGCHSILLHLHATRDVPVTFYTDAFRADVQLHPGEQIIRMDLRNFDQFDVGKPMKIKSIALDVWPQDNFYPYPEAKDVSITVLGLTASNREPLPAGLPYAGRTVWLSALRATVPLGPPHDPLAVPREHVDKLRRTRQEGNIDRFLPRGKERFRTWCAHRTLTPMTALLTGGDPGAKAAALGLHRYLERAFGVRLAVDPEGARPGPDLGGAFLVGRKAAHAAGRVTDRELDYVGRGGFTIHAADGRVALAGVDAEGTAAAVERYLGDHGIRLYGPGIEAVADMKADFLHELYTLDKPWFVERPGWDRWWLSEPAKEAALPLGDTVDGLRLATNIKNLARAGNHEAPAGLLAEAGKTRLSRYLALRLLRNPLDDATRAVREFPATSRGPGRDAAPQPF